MSESVCSTTNKTLGPGMVWRDHRPPWNDPYKNFEQIRTVRPKAKVGDAVERIPTTIATARKCPEFKTPGERSAFDLGVIQATRHGALVGNPFRKEVAEWAAWNAGAESARKEAA